MAAPTSARALLELAAGDPHVGLFVAFLTTVYIAVVVLKGLHALRARWL